MSTDKMGSTAYNRPHQAMIHFSARGYAEYRADLIRRLEQQDRGFVLRDDDFINAFIDLTAYVGEVLMTYQNAYAQEIFLETAQLRESLFNLAAMVDYCVDPGAGATSSLVVLANPGKAGLLPKGFQVSGKEEDSKEAVFFETEADLLVDARYNDFSLSASERFTDMALAHTLTILDKIAVKTGQYLYFHAPSAGAHLFVQIQTTTIDEPAGTTTVEWTDASRYLYPSSASSLKVGDGEWGLMVLDARGVLKIEGGAVWLDGKYEAIAKDAPVVVRYDTSVNYGTVTSFSFETLPVKVGLSTRIAETDSTGENEEKISQYTIDTKTFYVIQKTHVEPREVAKLVVAWLTTAPADYPAGGSGTDIACEKSSHHMVFVGVQKPLQVETRSPNHASLAGVAKLLLDGDFSGMEKYRTLVLHELVNGDKTLETVEVLKVGTLGSGSTIQTEMELKSTVGKNFTQYGVKIWGNVVKATQGKTVAKQILGSGRGEESYQSFDLPRSPLTFQRQGSKGVKPAIDLKVSDLIWEAQDDFLESGPEDRHFLVETGFDAKSRVVFGDGVNGARVPTGKDNIIATFRSGLGKAGNVSAGILKKPSSKPPFLKELFNPEKAFGGSDADTEEQLREKVPVQQITFDRAVSLQDYADLALSFDGVGKAKAGLRWVNNRQVVVLAVAGEAGEDATSLLPDLRDYLDARRDINQPLLVKEVDRVPILLTINVIVSSGYDVEKVKDAIRKALGSGVNEDGTLQFFNFDRLALGMSIHKKDIYRVLEGIPGVQLISGLVIQREAPVATGQLIPSFCSEDVWIYNWELAELDTTALSIVANQPPANILCERAGG